MKLSRLPDSLLRFEALRPQELPASRNRFHPTRGLLTIVLCCFASTSPPGAQQTKIEVQEQPGNVILMDDNFEYAVLDYGFGRIRVRTLGARKDFSQPVFWVKFRITNKADHLIQSPRYFPSVLDSFRVVDNWGNFYLLRYPQASDVGGSWHGAELPVPGSELRERFKPGESSWAVRLIPEGDFVENVTELWVYLANQFDKSKTYFRIADPTLRQKDLLRDQADPIAAELRIKVVTEKPLPAQRQGARKRKS